MLSLDQVNLLESKVEKAVDLIRSLSSERDDLKAVISKKDARIAELEKLILTFKDEQSKIEEGIANALNRLSAFEDSINEGNSVFQSSGNPVKTEYPKTEEINAAKQPVPAAEQTETESENPVQNSGDKDLNDILGNNEVSNKENGSSDDSDKQMDIF